MGTSMALNTTYTLISGANSGIGQAVATILAKEHGHHVIIGSRKADAGDRLAKSIKSEGFLASSVQLDLESDSSIEAAIRDIDTQFGRIDVLVNNAGILIDTTAKHLSIRELFNKTYNTNVAGTAALTDAALPLLRKAKLPRVVFVSSRMGSLHLSKDDTVPWYNIDYKAYDASKAAMNVVGLNYARILGDVGARVNIVCPGLVATNLAPGVSGGAPPEVGAQQVVKMATIDESGPTKTFTATDGEQPW